MVENGYFGPELSRINYYFENDKQNLHSHLELVCQNTKQKPRFLVLVVLLPTAALEKCAEGKLNKGGWYLCIGPD